MRGELMKESDILLSRAEKLRRDARNIRRDATRLSLPTDQQRMPWGVGLCGSGHTKSSCLTIPRRLPRPNTQPAVMKELNRD